MNRSRDLLFAAGASAGVVIALALGFVSMGSPVNQRAKQGDAKRVQDLYQISTEVRRYWLAHGSQGTLPQTLAEISPASPRLDPETKAPYVYAVRRQSAYMLCATFSGSTQGQAGQPETQWPHPAGRFCFERDAAALHGPFPADP